MARTPPSPRKPAAPKPSPAPAPEPALVEAPAAEAAPLDAPATELAEDGDPSASTASASTLAEPGTASVGSTDASAELAAPGATIAEPAAEPAANEGDARHELLGKAERAIEAALDALDEVARSGVFFAETAADKLIATTARQGFDAMRKVMVDTEAAIGSAIATLRYEGLERRAFVLVADVQLDGTHYGPSSAEPGKPAPLTAEQHAELAAVRAVESDWDAGEPVEAD